MARFNIIDAKTGSVKYSGTPRYNGTYCKVSYLEFSEICSDSLISWNIGDYIVYPRTGLTYRLFDIPQPKKRSYRSEYGGAYVYSNVQFFADTKWLEIEPFRDIVPADNKIHFTTQSSWSVWTNVEGLIARLNAVMQAVHPDEWEFRLVNASEDSELYKLLHVRQGKSDLSSYCHRNCEINKSRVCHVKVWYAKLYLIVALQIEEINFGRKRRRASKCCPHNA